MSSASADKHPISVGQPTEFTLCWRIHRDGWACLLDEGHPSDAAPEPHGALPLGDADA